MKLSSVHRSMSFLLAAVLALAATAAEPSKKPSYVDPNAYSGYGPAMAPKQNDPMAVEWHNKNDAALKAATTPEALAAHLGDAAAAKALLGKVKGAYATDPMVLTVAAAVTQHVMRPCACQKKAACRALWSQALLDAAKGASDPYVQMFCLDQLRWCGSSSQAAAIKAFGASARDKAVRDFAEMVAREL